MDKLRIVRDIAKQKKIVGRIEISPNEKTKYRIHINGKFIDFGSSSHQDFLDHKDEERRKRFHSRFKNNVGYNDPSSALYYSRILLW